VLHELGHFIPARIFKTRVEKFFLFFDIKGALFQKKIGETVYGIGWLPLGGYVKIAGMIDESMDKEQMAQPAQPWEFRSKPAWQRLIIMLGGVTVNLILGVLIYGMILFVWGDRDLKMDQLPYGLSFEEPLNQLGLQDGDVLVSLGGEEIELIDDFRRMAFGANVTEAEVLRNGMRQTVQFPVELGQYLLDSSGDLPKGEAPFKVNFPTIVASVAPGGGAAEAGILPGDRIVSVAGNPTPYFFDVVGELAQHKGEDEVPIGIIRERIEAKVDRVASPMPAGNGGLTLNASVDPDGKLGFFNVTYEEIDGFVFVEQNYTLATAAGAGAEKAWNTLTGYVSSMRYLFRPGGTKQLGGFITLGSIFDPEWNWKSFWNITALLSIILAFMNLLPIPALDGGHVMFLLYEMISGRKPAEKVMEYGQLLGLLFIGALMLLANGNDLWKWFTGQL
jgi:regulator of sigma E protease